MLELDASTLLLGMDNGELHLCNLSTQTSKIIAKTELSTIYDMIKPKFSNEELAIIGEGGVIFGRINNDAGNA
eukprot:CAMPEP_0170549580 /NCGR_PEP_ID=MMETSP0211-20121228/7721_1 /TAXON_ID=311385 /ORGANISM="Pseudokeronopsis sp., Strain OXSARD2" /LENGTH=72 /DNA_ID=CAMNT_0010855663 /DNA_START=769 /DNA_END=987 /DNA_ORIENTATION=-